MTLSGLELHGADILGIEVPRNGTDGGLELGIKVTIGNPSFFSILMGDLDLAGGGSSLIGAITLDELSVAFLPNGSVIHDVSPSTIRSAFPSTYAIINRFMTAHDVVIRSRVCDWPPASCTRA